jgi:gamma-glutamyl-gamma-aminobutyrate hydrolase PuuD
MRPDRFVLGVQWHPEIGWERDDFSKAIFRRFIEAAT